MSDGSERQRFNTFCTLLVLVLVLLLCCCAAVSDMANGGQVLLDSSTFQGVRDRLTELSTVDARGYNVKLWTAAAKAVLRQHNTGLLGVCK
jgi:hypothetical protein